MCKKKKFSTTFFQQEVMCLSVRPGSTHSLHNIFKNNVIRCVRHPDDVALFVAASRFNHCCCPKAVIDSSRYQCVIRAAANISEGEEVCIAYTCLADDCGTRRQNLMANWGFECACSRCEQEALMDPQLLVPCKCGTYKFSI